MHTLLYRRHIAVTRLHRLATFPLHVPEQPAIHSLCRRVSINIRIDPCTRHSCKCAGVSLSRNSHSNPNVCINRVQIFTVRLWQKFVIEANVRYRESELDQLSSPQSAQSILLLCTKQSYIRTYMFIRRMHSDAECIPALRTKLLI